MKTTDTLLQLGFPENESLLNSVAEIVDKNDFTENGIKEIVKGFVTLDVPRFVETRRGNLPLSLELMKVFFDYKRGEKE